jgi:S-DNA-T family DNA segregation ATPase FtsK/SpoIIIE
VLEAEEVPAAVAATSTPRVPDVPEDAEAEDEPEVVLVPHPPGGDHERLVREAGELFLEQGRVAVSLLQRRFGLDFDEACNVLDDLQEAGLIGPYRGGQRRDILLTLQEWQARVAVS